MVVCFRYLCINDLTGKGSVSPLSPMNSLICQQPLWQQGVREDGVLTKYKGLNSGEMWRIEDVFPGVLFIEHTFAAYTLVTACIEVGIRLFLNWNSVLICVQLKF